MGRGCGGEGERVEGVDYAKDLFSSLVDILEDRRGERTYFVVLFGLWEVVPCE